jgi:4'-phosphopantetheinyl transferase
MTSPGWLTRSIADVPEDDGWLGRGERGVLAGLRFEKRRLDWRLGRFAAKAAVAVWLGPPAGVVEIVAASDGAPEAFVGDDPVPVSLSLSHRGGRALAVVGEAGTALGCDLELIEPRSRAFVADWLAPAEQALVADAGASERHLLINLLWTAKEAASKARREGLRLDPRHAVAKPAGIGSTTPGWRRLEVVWSDGGGRAAGWWRSEPDWVMAIAGEPAPGVPRALDAVATGRAPGDGP